MIIKRDSYLKQLIKKENNKMIKIVTGLRRVGKSYLLFNLFYNHLLSTGVSYDHIITLSLDEDKNRKYRDIDNLRDYIYSFIKDDKKYYILLDEVQFAISKEEIKNGEYIRLYGLLNELIREDNLDVYITGSNSRFLSTDIKTEFRGRGDEICVYPLTFKEYYESTNKSKEEAFSDYLLFGGLPYIATLEDKDQKANYLNEQLKTTYINDVIERNNITNEAVLKDLLNFLASSIGSLTNPNKLLHTFISKNIKTSAETISNYLKYLEEAFIIKSVNRYNIKGKNYLGTPLKYYFTDLGLRNAQIGYRQIEVNHLMENIIYNELKARGFQVDVGSIPVQEMHDGKRSLVTYEVDFVCNRFNKCYYIQSALSVNDPLKLLQETAGFKKIDDSFEKIILVKDSFFNYQTIEGYKVINILDFLLDKDLIS